MCDTDIVLNVDELEDAILNYGFTIYSLSRDEFVQKGEVKRITAFGNVYVEGYIRAV
ncbi:MULTISPECIES: hypothetical protein [Flavobacterium]|uniref:Uncharacterized protein n=1 Tax=Flavobacterium ginsengiterrae TaxID=871695 RepID=A0ABP7GQF6_9FLAO|nr:hypothetical protein [Flavobacterium gelatinilyticum]